MKYKIDYVAFTANPITWADAKYWLRLDDEATEQTQVMELVKDGIAHAESLCERTFVQRSLVVKHYEQADKYFLPRGPLSSIASVVDANNVTITAGQRELEESGNWSYLKVNVSHEMPLTVTYTAGHSVLPRDVKRAILMWTELNYRDRGGADTTGIDRILSKWSNNTWAG